MASCQGEYSVVEGVCVRRVAKDVPARETASWQVVLKLKVLWIIDHREFRLQRLRPLWKIMILW
jgi:hypothetical protein